MQCFALTTTITLPVLSLSRKLPQSRRVRGGYLHKNQQSNMDIQKSQDFLIVSSQYLGKPNQSLIL